VLLLKQWGNYMVDVLERLLSLIFALARPNLNGPWYFLLRFEHASHGDYLGMLVQWQANILSDGKNINGSAERRSESSRRHPPFVYRHESRQKAQIKGVMRYALRPKCGWVVDFYLVHMACGAARETTSSQTLTSVTSQGMSGTFRGDASDSSGRVSWSRKVIRLSDMTFFAIGEE
jgi:hypothetical protein